MGKTNAPIFDKLVSHYKKSTASFHVPGHKMGKGFNPMARKYYKDLLKLDMTEISGLDDLHHARGIIFEAENRAANLYGADKTFFLVNGSTSGNIAMILAVCKPGDKIIVQRDVHKSVINGLILARARPIYIDSERIIQLGIAGGIKENSLIAALKTNKDVKAVLITNPSYYGISINVKKISEIVHKYKIPLLVDEAHGAHFGFHSRFPSSAIQNGADISVQSTHKTLSAMTMGSMLHIKSKYIDIDKLGMFLSMIQTSSPSYPILASLDLSRSLIESEGEKLWDRALVGLDNFNQKAINLRNIKVIHNLKNDKILLDPLKIIIHSKNRCYSGVSIQRNLENRRIYTELADLYNTLAIISSASDRGDFKNLLSALIKIDNEINGYKIIQDNNEDIIFDYYPDSIGLKEVSLDKMLYSRTTMVPMHEAIGKIAAEMIAPYPPGIPIIQIGEVITKEIAEYLQRLRKTGVNVQGIYINEFVNNIKVIKDTE